MAVCLCMVPITSIPVQIHFYVLNRGNLVKGINVKWNFSITSLTDISAAINVLHDSLKWGQYMLMLSSLDADL